MQFLRRNLQYQANIQSTSNGEFFNILNNCGFVTLDGESVPFDGSSRYIKWMYDKNVVPEKTGGAFYIDRKNYMDFKYCDAEDNSHTLQNCSKTDPFCLFFIPLKNKGFFISFYDYDYSNAYNTEPLTSTPKLRNRDKGAFYQEGDFCVKPVTGVYNNITNDYCYFSPYQPKDFSGDWLDFKEFRLQKGTSIIRDLDNTKTDYKANVVTLIKYPYENGFLNNLFIITTVPQKGCKWNSNTNTWTDNNIESYGLSNKFFSFGGRNFYGVDCNLAVELPAN